VEESSSFKDCHKPQKILEKNAVLADLQILLFIYLFIYFFVFKATPVAYGGSQARGLIGATAASLCHRHSHAGTELSLRPTTQLMATPDP